jgi:hypothetical protein
VNDKRSTDGNGRSYDSVAFWPLAEDNSGNDDDNDTAVFKTDEVTEPTWAVKAKAHSL